MLKERCKYSLKDVNLIYKDITMLRQKKRGKVERVACVFNLFYVQTFITSFKIRFFLTFLLNTTLRNSWIDARQRCNTGSKILR